MEPITYGIAGLTLFVGLAIGFYINRLQTEKAQRQQREKADKMVSEAREQSRTIEIQARDNALKISRNAESEITRLRSEKAKANSA